MKNPIIERELIGTLRTRKALALQVTVAMAFALLVVVSWPTDALVDLSGSQSRQVFHLFGYGLLAAMILLVPVFPATSIVRERVGGTLELLLNSPMNPISIYFGKLAGVLGFILLLLIMSFPGAAACYAMGGVEAHHIVELYGLLALVALQYAALGLLVSSYAQSTDSALRITYVLVLLMAVVTLGPHLVMQGKDSLTATAAFWLRSLSPIPAVMEVLGHSDVGAAGQVAESGAPLRYVMLAIVTTAAFIVRTITRFNSSMLDYSRAQGIITDERGAAGQWARRLIFLVDPQRRKGGIGPFTNPVMVKEFRCRRFGRSHWILRLVAGCALLSMVLTYAATVFTESWGVNDIGGILVVLQVALIVMLTPSLAAGLISGERESGGWALLQMTPLSTGAILRGKLMSVVWTLLLILCATLPGYLVMIIIKPDMTQQVIQVLICLVWTAVFAILVSAAISSLFPRTAPATTTTYLLLVGMCVGTMLVWFGRDSRFGRGTVERILTVNPMAAALNVIEARGFQDYNLVPANWYFVGCASALALAVLIVQTWRLARPQ